MAEKQKQVEEHDRVIGELLERLAWDMVGKTRRFQPVPATLVTRGKTLVKGVKIDLDTALSDDETRATTF